MYINMITFLFGVWRQNLVGVLLHFGGDGAGGFIALVEVGDDLVIALFVAVLAELGGGLVFGDEDLETDDAAKIIAEAFPGDLVHVDGLGQVVFVIVHEPRERGMARTCAPSTSVCFCSLPREICPARTS